MNLIRILVLTVFTVLEYITVGTAECCPNPNPGFGICCLGAGLDDTKMGGGMFTSVCHLQSTAGTCAGEVVPERIMPPPIELPHEYTLTEGRFFGWDRVAVFCDFAIVWAI